MLIFLQPEACSAFLPAFSVRTITSMWTPSSRNPRRTSFLLRDEFLQKTLWAAHPTSFLPFQPLFFLFFGIHPLTKTRVFDFYKLAIFIAKVVMQGSLPSTYRKFPIPAVKLLFFITPHWGNHLQASRTCCALGIGIFPPRLLHYLLLYSFKSLLNCYFLTEIFPDHSIYLFFLSLPIEFPILSSDALTHYVFFLFLYFVSPTEI